MNADLPVKFWTRTSVSVDVHGAASQTFRDTRELSGPPAGSPVPCETMPIMWKWLARMLMSEPRRTVAPVAGSKVIGSVRGVAAEWGLIVISEPLPTGPGAK